MYKLLLVDDESEIREGLREVVDFRSLGFEVVGEAANGIAGLQMAESLSPDLIITDIRMPLMDGIALALAAKREFPDLTIMLMTGYAEQRERAKSLETIVAEVMAKPFTIAELRETVMRVIERSIG